MSINKAMISGNLTRDSELRATTSGSSVLSFSVAVNDRRKNQSSGEWEDVPNYIDCTVFGPRAESIARFLSKGTKVAVEGKLRWSQWERDGQKRSKIEIIVDEIEFLSARDTATAPAQVTPRDVDIPAAPEVAVYDEDIPF
jgi:single-strand DNA-binding protein